MKLTNTLPGSLIRVLLSGMFFISATGKLLDSSSAISMIVQLFHLPLWFSKTMVGLLIIFELIMAAIIWKARIPKIFIAIPVLFFITALFSDRNDLNCGCFGSLPLFSQMSFGAHLALLAGMSLGIWYLINEEKLVKKSLAVQPVDFRLKVISFSGYVALLAMFAAFVSLPFSAKVKHDPGSIGQYQIVDRAFVKAVIDKQQFIIIDARPAFQYELGHIPQAVNIPYNHSWLDSVIQDLGLAEKSLVLYCSDAHCNASEILAKRLSKLGCSSIAIYQAGWKDWVEMKIHQQ